MSGASVIMHKRNKYIRIFNKLGAIDEEHSITLDEIGIRRNYLFNRMTQRGIFIRCENGKFYIDNEETLRFKKKIRKRGLVGLIIILIFAMVCYFAGIQ
jgi:hypothetical protein